MNITRLAIELALMHSEGLAIHRGTTHPAAELVKIITTG